MASAPDSGFVGIVQTLRDLSPASRARISASGRLTTAVSAAAATPALKPQVAAAQIALDFNEPSNGLLAGIL